MGSTRSLIPMARNRDGTSGRDSQTDHGFAGPRNVHIDVKEQAMERTFGFIMLGVLIVVAFLGVYYSH